MTEELYVAKDGFKCVKSQLAKTDGRDPREHAQAAQRYAQSGDKAAFVAEVKALKVRAPEYEDN